MASKVPKKMPAVRKKANGYKMPGHIPKGEVMKDISNNKWIVNTSIGIGGFGEIYSAAKESDKSQNKYVIKVEPSENGPLFCEKTVYLKIGKKEDIEEYMKRRKLKSLGMPRFYGCGTHTCGSIKYRFLVMERYGKDLWTAFLEKGRIFSPSAVFKIGIQIVDVLEYIHSKTYVHADVKGANLLLGLSKGTENQVYLVDFGLASRFPTTEFKPNPKKAHNGTLEYTSRDAHLGVPTRRGDIEILGYNMLQWVSSSLPWEKSTNPNEVETQKKESMKDCGKFIKTWVKDTSAGEILAKFFQSLCKLQPLEEPEYDVLRQTLRSGTDSNGKLVFSPAKSSGTGKTSRAPKTGSSASATDEPVSKRTRANLSKANDDGTDGESEEDDGDLFRITPPPTKEKVKRSWKDAPTIVSCCQERHQDKASIFHLFRVGEKIRDQFGIHLR